MSKPVVEGLAYDWRGARAESLHTTETRFLLRARPARGPGAENLTSLQIFSSNELGGFVARRNACWEVALLRVPRRPASR